MTSGEAAVAARTAVRAFNEHVRACSSCGEPPDPSLCAIGARLNDSAAEACAAMWKADADERESA